MMIALTIGWPARTLIVDVGAGVISFSVGIASAAFLARKRLRVDASRKVARDVPESWAGWRVRRRTQAR